ncbi:pyridoxal 5'-phosphate synthase [Gottfriedia sp. NPDC056225]|uniref:pyridoxine/pyridoxamine 5'-phosphate oxidase n=1 Tax=Gottfriedia sp. NPDC056225 TaxID=3345751 RepID=UPI0035D6EA3A
MDDIRKAIRKCKTLNGPFPEFNINNASEYPNELFLEWYQEAVDYGVHETHSMALSTTDHNGYPDARVLIIKDVDQHGWYFATSLQSEKGKQIDFNPNVAMTFYWTLIGRQVRIRGRAIKMEKELSAQDFLARGTVARAVALIGKQSSILKEHFEFDEALNKQIEILQQNPNLVFPSWTLYRVVAKVVEFWQADENRRHIRLKYCFEGDRWGKKLLWP